MQAAAQHDVVDIGINEWGRQASNTHKWRGLSSSCPVALAHGDECYDNRLYFFKCNLDEGTTEGNLDESDVRATNWEHSYYRYTAASCLEHEESHKKVGITRSHIATDATAPQT